MALMLADSHRLAILTAEEIEDLYGLPLFSDDRHLYFDLSDPERDAADSHTFSVAVHLILQFGYFKGKRQFFNYEQDSVLEDLRVHPEKYAHAVGCHLEIKFVPKHAR